MYLKHTSPHDCLFSVHSKTSTQPNITPFIPQLQSSLISYTADASEIIIRTQRRPSSPISTWVHAACAHTVTPPPPHLGLSATHASCAYKKSITLPPLHAVPVWVRLAGWQTWIVPVGIR